MYGIYQSYNNIVKELKQIKEKCINEGVSKKEAFTSYINENYVKDQIVNTKNGILTTLKSALKNVS